MPVEFMKYEMSSGRLLRHKYRVSYSEHVLDQVSDEPGCSVVMGWHDSPETKFVRDGEVLARSEATAEEIAALDAADDAVSNPPPPAVTPEQVWRERDRRLAYGFDFDFADERGIHHIGTSDNNMRGWNQVTTWATVQLLTQNFAAWLSINTDTGTVVVTATEWMTILNAATGYLDPVWQGSFVLLAMDPIPVTYADDQWWQP